MVSRKPIADEETSTAQTADRRAFLRGLAVFGAGTLGAASVHAAPSLSRRVGADRLTRAPRANLKLTTPVKRLQVVKPGTIPAEFKPLALPRPVAIPTPSTRLRLLKAMIGSPGGADLISDSGLEPAAIEKLGLSKSLQVMSNNTLASAYAAGVVLTPTGCEYGEGVAPLPKPPIFYQSWSGSLSVETVSAGECYVHGMHQMSADGALWFCFITTPGAATDKLTYLLELSINSVYNNYLDRLKFSLNFAELTMSSTSDGTLVAAVELCGTEQNTSAHWFAIHNKLYELGSFGFNWLNVMAL